MKSLRKTAMKLMNMVTPSGYEDEVREYLYARLVGMFGKKNVWIDSYGNLFGEYKVGSGEGATVILSSHMDSVNNYGANHKLIFKDGIIRAENGICGADDKAGLAIILEILKNVEKTSFEGTIKTAFFVEEEIGCVGSSEAGRNESKEWLADANLGIVIDRKGSRDIVVGNFGEVFCSDATGDFFEEASKMQDMDWKCVEGGISDTSTLAQLGVNAVNLSAGYYNEHTKNEYVVLDQMVDTYRLILQVFGIINHHFDKFGEVPQDENKWVSNMWSYGSWGRSNNWNKYPKYDSHSYYDPSMESRDDEFIGADEDTREFEVKHQNAIEQVDSIFGKTKLHMPHKGIVYITQGTGSKGQEIVLKPSELEQIAIAYYDHKYNVTSAVDSGVAVGISEDDLPF